MLIEKMKELKNEMYSLERFTSLGKTQREKDNIEYIYNTIQNDIENAQSTDMLIDDLSSIYATILYPIMFDDLKENKELANKYGELNWYILDEVQEINYNAANELLHYIHLQNPRIREVAIEKIANARENITKEKFEKIYIFKNIKVWLDKFPEELKQKIETALKNIRADIKISYGTTWDYSHLNMGIDYVYKDNENPQLTIVALDKATIDIVDQKIKSLFGDEIEDWTF